MTDEILDGSVGAESGKRPTFLTVLCILTFVGSGLGVLGGLLGLLGSSAFGMFSPTGGVLTQIMGLGAAGLCLFGAIQMWGLKKQGFMIYVAGAVLSIVGAILGAVMFSSAMSEVNAEISSMDGYNSYAASSVETAATAGMWIGVFLTILINVAFILMYNANKKHLVN